VVVGEGYSRIADAWAGDAPIVRRRRWPWAAPPKSWLAPPKTSNSEDAPQPLVVAGQGCSCIAGAWAGDAPMVRRLRWPWDAPLESWKDTASDGAHEVWNKGSAGATVLPKDPGSAPALLPPQSPSCIWQEASTAEGCLVLLIGVIKSSMSVSA